MKVLWKTDPELSALHAAAVVASGAAVVDPRIDAALRGPAAAIHQRLEMAESDTATFWHTLLATSGEDPPRVEAALLAAGCSELVVDSVATAVLGRLADARLALAEQFPKLRDQLPLRARPLRELWEAVGPGLLREIGRRTTEKIIPPRTTVHLVQPVRGGDGGLLLGGEAVWIEAVLTHPDPAVPETLRLAWLIARGGLARPAANRWVEADRLPRAAALALLPITLSAGQELGLCEASDPGIAATAELWGLGDDADCLLRWWSQMRQGELPLPVAIKAASIKCLDNRTLKKPRQAPAGYKGEPWESVPSVAIHSGVRLMSPWQQRLYAQVVWLPTLWWNYLLGRVFRVRRWWDRIDPHVIVGAYPFARDVPGLFMEGVRGVVNTCEEYHGPSLHYEAAGIEQLRIPTTDFTHPRLDDVLLAVEFIQRHVEAGDSVYIHCKAGRARSATVAMCWLVKYRGLTPAAAQELLLEKRPHVHPRLTEREVVQQFVASLTHGLQRLEPE